jgi:LAO/AO transport system kinase
MSSERTTKLVDDMLGGSRVALSRLLSAVENHRGDAGEILRHLSARQGHAIRIGVTGPPGAGKSSLVTAYVKLLRSQEKKVAVLAVDPTSPFSGGALLGDRIRMNSISMDPGVFVRSLAARGDLGGLSEAAGDMADVMDAAGFDVILFETVGVGQSELEIAEYADSTVVVLVPESGDSIQGMKAGLMEIADLFAVNKCDREGADRFAADLSAALHLRAASDWTPPVVQTIAVKDQGLDTFHEKLTDHFEFLKSSGQLMQRREKRVRSRIHRLVEQRLTAEFWTAERVQKMETAIRSNRSPYEISIELLRDSH